MFIQNRKFGERPRRTAELFVALTGIGLVAVAVVYNHAWLDHHILPDFFVAHDSYLAIADLVRLAMVLLGACLTLFGRRRLARILAGLGLAGAFRLATAVLLALVVSELVLRATVPALVARYEARHEPARLDDARLGWVSVPNHVGQSVIGGRRIEYRWDANGYRVRDARHGVDLDRPTLIFAGESVMFGHGLTWDESIPAQVGKLLNLQSANLAVNAYSTDQTAMRSAIELTHFRQPVAIVTLFSPDLFFKNLNPNRPHFDSRLVWHRADNRWRLRVLFDGLNPFSSDASVAAGVSKTRAVLRATRELARQRHAKSLVVVPMFNPEQPAERELRHRVLDGTGLPFVVVSLDPSLRIPIDGHPNARAATLIARAIASSLSAD